LAQNSGAELIADFGGPRDQRGGRLRVNLRHERFVPTGPLNPNLPPLQARPQAAAVRQNRKSPIAETAVRHIAALYAIEADVRGHAPEARLAARKKLSAPIVEALKPWFEKQLSLISSGSTLAGDIRYALSHWAGLTRFLEDGRHELDTNPVETAIRPVALTRKKAYPSPSGRINILYVMGFAARPIARSARKAA